MNRSLCLATSLIALTCSSSAFAQSQAVERAKAVTEAKVSGSLDGLIARHSAANNVPEALVRRVIKRESRGNPRVISKGNYGLMQIRLGTARAMGYRGTAAGLLDADTNMTYAVKYLAGAYRVAGGNSDRAVHYYAAGYYYAAKSKGLLDISKPNPIGTYATAAAATGNSTVTTISARSATEVPQEAANETAVEAPAPVQIVDRFNVQ
jgi:soluble lytic murein transglycosylase-like protein